MIYYYFPFNGTFYDIRLPNAELTVNKPSCFTLQVDGTRAIMEYLSSHSYTTEREVTSNDGDYFKLFLLYSDS